jgi:hypothetical protein
MCRKFGAPITCRGGGTSLARQCCYVDLIVDFTKYVNHVLEIDPEKKLARVEPGHDEIEAGTPMIGPEPSCAAVFRDALVPESVNGRLV